MSTRASSLEQALQLQESLRERTWSHHAAAFMLKLQWRALCAEHCFHIVPGESVLELGAGSGLWTEALGSVLGDENPITAAVFSEGLAGKGCERKIPNTRFVHVKQLGTDLAPASFDWVIGSSMLWHDQLPELLSTLYRLLKPGGQFLFFEPNLLHPKRGHLLRAFNGSGFKASADRVLYMCSHQGFTHVDLKPYDLLPVTIGAGAVRFLHAKTLLLEHAPMLRNLCSSMYVWARKPGSSIRKIPSLTKHRQLQRSVSVVIPCRNESQNLPHLVERLLECYNSYIHEVICVNDGSVDDTAAVVEKLASADPRVRLITRSKPNGVGLALRDGYQAASGRYILSMDCDFVEIVPDFRGLFDAIAAGYDGAIGSRFSHDSLLVNYPFSKLLFNRGLHALVKTFLIDVRDITNNLKLCRSEILKNLVIESPHFSANLETGLKPLLMGYKIKEVPISWINRTVEMGASSFHLKKVGFEYAKTLLRIWKAHRAGNVASFYKTYEPVANTARAH